jgi:hypothetical protein
MPCDERRTREVHLHFDSEHGRVTLHVAEIRRLNWQPTPTSSRARPISILTYGSGRSAKVNMNATRQNVAVMGSLSLFWCRFRRAPSKKVLRQFHLQVVTPRLLQ